MVFACVLMVMLCAHWVLFGVVRYIVCFRCFVLVDGVWWCRMLLGVANCVWWCLVCVWFGVLVGVELRVAQRCCIGGDWHYGVI